jgi:hypothetical protein
LEKLINKLDFEIGQIKPSVIVGIILISDVEDDFVFFVAHLGPWV